MGVGSRCRRLGTMLGGGLYLCLAWGLVFWGPLKSFLCWEGGGVGQGGLEVLGLALSGLVAAVFTVGGRTVSELEL